MDRVGNIWNDTWINFGWYSKILMAAGSYNHRFYQVDPVFSSLQWSLMPAQVSKLAM